MKDKGNSMTIKTFKRDGAQYSREEMKAVVDGEITHMQHVKTGRKAVAIRMSQIGTSDNVLDVGSEIGTFLVSLKEKAKDTTQFVGVDVNSNSHKIAMEFCKQDRIDFFQLSSEKLPFENEKFDRVFALEVLEHLRNVEISLQEIHRVTRKGGLFVLSVPNATSFRSLLKAFLKTSASLSTMIESWPKFAPDQRDHVNNYDFLHLYRILNLSGFKFKSVEYTGWKFPWLGRIPVIKKFCSTMVMSVEKI